MKNMKNALADSLPYMEWGREHFARTKSTAQNHPTGVVRQLAAPGCDE